MKTNYDGEYPNNEVEEFQGLEATIKKQEARIKELGIQIKALNELVNSKQAEIVELLRTKAEMFVEKEEAETNHALILESTLQNADRQLEQAKAETRREIERLKEQNAELKMNGISLNARIKELESELEIIDKNYRIKKGETWYWEKDSNNYLESLTCPVIINANDLRDLISEARADQNKKIARALQNRVDAQTDYAPYPNDVNSFIAKLQKGEEVK